jgi:hypothetical protein
LRLVLAPARGRLLERKRPILVSTASHELVIPKEL